MKKIVLITTGQPSVNPRIVKEADALHAAGHQVTVLFCYWIQWAADADKKLLQRVKWNYKGIGGSPTHNRLIYNYTRLRLKINKTLNRRFGNRFLFAERTQTRCYDELLKAAVSLKADWYIGHNLGALPVVVTAARINQASAGFDFEDYHREENLDVPAYQQKRIVYLEEKHVPYLNYISVSSPLIKDKVKEHFPTISAPIITLLNCFSKKGQPVQVPETDYGKLQLFWFSQTIGKNRGLETILAAIEKLNNQNIHLTLVGRSDKWITDYLNEIPHNIKNNVHLAGIIHPDDIPLFAAQFDIGLAAEKVLPENRNICLTNKFFTYLVAGSCVLASDTKAQKEFLLRYNDIGLLYRHDDQNDLAEKISTLFNDRQLLEACKSNARNLARSEMNWEQEVKKLFKVIL